MRATVCGVLLITAVGCTRKEPAPKPVAASPAASTAPAVPPATQPPARPALATGEGATAGVRVEVTELKRASGGTVNLKFAMVNESDKDVGVGEYVGTLVDVNAAYTIGGVHLIDPVGKKKYFVARDAGQGCVCSAFKGVGRRGRVNHWAKFPAPPDDVEKISVVIPGFSPMDDVALSR